MPTKPPKEIGLLLSHHHISLCCYSSWWQSGHGIKKQANKQQICCHKHLSTTWWVLRVGAWGSPKLQGPEETHQLHFPLCLPYSNLLIRNSSWIPDPWEDRCSRKWRKSVHLFGFASLPWVVNGKPHNFSCTPCDREWQTGFGHRNPISWALRR